MQLHFLGVLLVVGSILNPGTALGFPLFSTARWPGNKTLPPQIFSNASSIFSCPHKNPERRTWAEDVTCKSSALLVSSINIINPYPSRRRS